MYRVGLPGWKLAARFGVPVLVRVVVFYDKESNTYWAESPDLDGLTVSGATLDELKSEVLSASAELLALTLEGSAPPKATTRLTYQENAYCAA